MGLLPAVDGSFGSGTLSAVKNFQSSHGLSADGMLGNASGRALNIVTQQGNLGPLGYSYLLFNYIFKLCLLEKIS